MIKASAFSLIELMVTVAIVSLLAAVAVPAYKQYIYSANISKVMAFADNLKKQMIENYNTTGTFAGPIDVGGAVLSDTGDVAFPDEYYPLGKIHWHFPSAGTVQTSLFVLTIKGLDGIDPLYVEPYAGDGYTGVKSAISFMLVDEDGTIKTYCGAFGTTPTGDLPTAYLHRMGCDCVAMAFSWSTGTPTCN